MGYIVTSTFWLCKLRKKSWPTFVLLLSSGSSFLSYQAVSKRHTVGLPFHRSYRWFFAVRILPKNLMSESW